MNTTQEVRREATIMLRSPLNNGGPSMGELVAPYLIGAAVAGTAAYLISRTTQPQYSNPVPMEAHPRYAEPVRYNVENWHMEDEGPVCIATYNGEAQIQYVRAGPDAGVTFVTMGEMSPDNKLIEIALLPNGTVETPLGSAAPSAEDRGAYVELGTLARRICGAKTRTSRLAPAPAFAAPAPAAQAPAAPAP